MQFLDAKQIVHTKKAAAWFGGDFNMNIYRGCSHGCIYCDSRSDCYGVQNFDTVHAKARSSEIIRDDLRRKVKRGVVMTGAMSDPYNPLEADTRFTRQALELVNAYGFGLGLATKSDLVLRDSDILCDIAEHSPVIIKLSIATADDALAAFTEPHVARPSARFGALRELAGRGLFCGILLMPVLPFLYDSEQNISEILARAAACGARFVYPGMGVTLRQNQREHYLAALDALFPGQDLRRRYEQTYGLNYQCTVPNIKKLWPLFKSLCDRYGLLYKMDDIIKAYKLGYESEQLKFY